MPEGSLGLLELLKQVGSNLKKNMPGSYWIMAEILELHVNRSGHCYLELIEKGSEGGAILARARATIWASKYSMLRSFFEASTGTALKSGIKLLCRGSVEFHTQFGFSINISDLDPAYTLGDLARKKQEVILKLRKEGVMEMNLMLPFPDIPQRIAVISSQSAAGYGDFMDSIRGNSRGYIFYTRLFQAVMQGDEAPSSIRKALDEIHQADEHFDCVIIIRGGGAKADLECYNDYELAYYLTQFPLPVISGIGHERDESIVDMVASRSLKTPTAVAEFLIDQLLAFEFRLSEYSEKLSSLVARAVQDHRMLLEKLAGNLLHYYGSHLRSEKDRLLQSSVSLRRIAASKITRERDRLEQLGKRNTLVNPENILRRGYSVTMHKGKALTSTRALKEGDVLETRVYQGTIISKTEKTFQKDGKKNNELPGSS